jgi:plasmid stabilization system protein ParE
MGQYYITDEAAADLAKLWDGYVERGGTEENADRLIASLFESFQNIADFPTWERRATIFPQVS